MTIIINYKNNMTDKEIEYFIFTICIHCEEKSKEIYSELQKKYNTSLEWLDNTYFLEESEKISWFSLKELEEFVKIIKYKLKEYFKWDKLFFREYFLILRWLINDLKWGEYWELSNKFSNDISIKNFFENELLELLWKESEDYSKVWFTIDDLKWVTVKINRYKYWENYKNSKNIV